MSVTASREIRHDRRQAQLATIDARNYATTWTTTEDRELLLGEGTVAERAARLGRTYYAAQRRLGKLRRNQQLAANAGLAWVAA